MNNTDNEKDFYEVATYTNRINNIIMDKYDHFKNSNGISQSIKNDNNTQNESDIKMLNNYKNLIKIAYNNTRNNAEKPNTDVINSNVQNIMISKLNNNTRLNEQGKITKIEILNNSRNVIKNMYNNKNLHQQSKFNKKRIISISILNNNQIAVENNNKKSISKLYKQVISKNNPFNLDENEYNAVLEIMEYFGNKRVNIKGTFDITFSVINDLRRSLYQIVREWYCYENKSEIQNNLINYISESLVSEYIKHSYNFINQLSECNSMLRNSITKEMENLILEKTKQLRNNNTNAIQTIDSIIKELNIIKQSINNKICPNITNTTNNIIQEIDNAVNSCKYIFYPIIVYMTLTGDHIEKVKNGNTIVSKDNNEILKNEEYLEKLQHYKTKYNNVLNKIKKENILGIIYQCLCMNVDNCIHIKNMIENIKTEQNNNNLDKLYYEIINILCTQSQIMQNYNDFYTNKMQIKGEIIASVLSLLIRITNKDIRPQIKELKKELKTKTINEIVNELDIGNLQVSEVWDEWNKIHK